MKNTPNIASWDWALNVERWSVLLEERVIVPVVQRIERGFPKAKPALLLVSAPIVGREQKTVL
jgi:hypothetical protein